MPFVIVDKADARVFVFDAGGQLRGASSALLGLARGDDSVPGIGQRKLSSILPEERTTPAGRFVAALDHNLQGKEMLWVDYETAISLHPVVTSNARERRAERLVTPSPLDNRISYGCINVPADFYASVVSPAFTGTDGIVYVLPETRSAHAVFGAYDVEERARLNMASQAVSAPVVSRSAANLAR
ncbi:MAG: L,D-transpeptidase [Xanthomonadaceae bacterium]|nr:L,D-transpeptidase [Xanthomonadaceae bacterium]